MGRLDGKVALVTGAARGLGAAIAVRFAAEGATVMLTDILREAGEEMARDLSGACFLEHDVASEGDWQRVVAEAVRRHGRLDVLVNNAGWAGVAEIEDCSLGAFRRHERIILEGTFLGCKYALPALRLAGGGAIVNVTALAAERGVETLPAYSAAKAGVHGLSRSIAADFKARRYGIRVNCVAPGPHDTPMTRAHIADRLGDTPAEGPAMATPTGVANAVLFLASDEARTINGQILTVDDGQSISSRSSAFLAPDSGRAGG